MFFVQPWFLFSVLAAIGLFVYQICVKIAGEQIPASIFASIMYTAGFIGMSLVFVFWLRNNDAQILKTLPFWAVFCSALAGVAVILVDICIATMFARSAPLGISMAFITVLSLAFATFAGFVFFGEKPSLVNIIGLILALGSVPLMLYVKE